MNPFVFVRGVQNLHHHLGTAANINISTGSACTIARVGPVVAYATGERRQLYLAT